MKRIKNMSSFPSWGMPLKTWPSRTSPYPPLATTSASKWEERGLLLLFFSFFFPFFSSPFFSAFILFLFLFLDFPPFSPPYLCSLLLPVTMALLLRSKVALVVGAGIKRLCHGPHSVGVGRKQTPPCRAPYYSSCSSKECFVFFLNHIT